MERADNKTRVQYGFLEAKKPSEKLIQKFWIKYIKKTLTSSAHNQKDLL
jgi:hypothetical protein